MQHSKWHRQHLMAFNSAFPKTLMVQLGIGTAVVFNSRNCGMWCSHNICAAQWIVFSSDKAMSWIICFLAATKQLYEWFSPSVCPQLSNPSNLPCLIHYLYLHSRYLENGRCVALNKPRSPIPTISSMLHQQLSVRQELRLCNSFDDLVYTSYPISSNGYVCAYL